MTNKFNQIIKNIKKIEKQLKIIQKHVKLYNIKNSEETNMKTSITPIKEQINVFDVANYIVKEKNIQASNLKLNKLIYYCYAKHLVDYHKKLLPSQVQAWRFGPVFPELYKTFKKYRDKIIINVPNITEATLNQNQTKIIDYIISKYSHLDTWDLIDKIHNEDPWRDTFPHEKLFSRRPISDEKILKYYSQNPI
ncbi:Panacea domain-containing protein [Candidatus Phytoplasma solani]|uniref:Panacea domain-containing protein n=1 Tax=Candidatus Phytoplasma solani TaxID=69896 RepID=UPI00358F06C3